MARPLRTALLLAAAFAAGDCFGKDFPEPAAAVDGLRLVEGGGSGASPAIPAGLGASFEYGNYALRHDDVDSFYFAVRAAPVFAALGDYAALSGSFAALLQCGPVPAGDTPANIAAFWMNSVQFEYALRASIRPWPGPGLPRLLLEYGRYSQHPLRGIYSEVTADILTAGLALPPRSLGPLSLQACLRAGYHDIFACWKSSLGPPRASWIVKPQVELDFEAARGLRLAARAYPSVFLDRYTGLWDADIAAEAGLSLGPGQTRMEFLLSVYASRDSELLSGTAHPAFEAGFVFRTATDRQARPGSGDKIARGRRFSGES